MWSWTHSLTMIWKRKTKVFYNFTRSFVNRDPSHPYPSICATILQFYFLSSDLTARHKKTTTNNMKFSENIITMNENKNRVIILKCYMIVLMNINNEKKNAPFLISSQKVNSTSEQEANKKRWKIINWKEDFSAVAK